MNDRFGNHHSGGDDPARQRRFRHGDNHNNNDRSAAGRVPLPPPEVGEIWEGKIHRIQPYGAFCSFGPVSGREYQGRQPRRAWQGLVHISQLSEMRVEKVEDAVDVDDSVWVKVLEVERQHDDNNHDKRPGPTRYRIKLSMKDVSQDGTKEDLGRAREAKEQATTQLETNLNSMIGIAVARDPMERLVLKSNLGSNNNNGTSASKTTFRGGYTLVDDDEGEPESDPSTAARASVADPTNHHSGASLRKAPMGRGRGATLPAWMTSSDGPVGAPSINPKEPSKAWTRKKEPTRDDDSDESRYRDDSDDNDDKDDNARSRRRRPASKTRKDKDKRRQKKKRKNRHRDYSDDDDDDDSNDSRRRSSFKTEKKKEKRRHSRRGDRDDDHDDSIDSRRRSPSKTEKKKEKKRHYHRGDSDGDDNGSNNSPRRSPPKSERKKDKKKYKKKSRHRRRHRDSDYSSDYSHSDISRSDSEERRPRKRYRSSSGDHRHRKDHRKH